jgi:hypothetical protein
MTHTRTYVRGEAVVHMSVVRYYPWRRLATVPPLPPPAAPWHAYYNTTHWEEVSHGWAELLYAPAVTTTAGRTCPCCNVLRLPGGFQNCHKALLLKHLDKRVVCAEPRLHAHGMRAEQASGMCRGAQERKLAASAVIISGVTWGADLSHRWQQC